MCHSRGHYKTSSKAKATCPCKLKKLKVTARAPHVQKILSYNNDQFQKKKQLEKKK